VKEKAKKTALKKQDMSRAELQARIQLLEEQLEQLDEEEH
jgi:hypothetical protein